MKKVNVFLVLIGLFAWSSVNAQTNYEHDSDIHTLAPSGLYGETVTFNAQVALNSEVWDEFIIPAVQFRYGTSLGEMYNISSPENVDPSTGYVSSTVEWLNPESDYFVRAEVIDLAGQWGDIYINPSEQPILFNSGESRRPLVEMSEPDSISFRTLGEFHVIIETPDVSGPEYRMQWRVYQNGENNAESVEYLDPDDIYFIDKMFVDLTPGEWTMIELSVGNYEYGYTVLKWYGELLEPTLPGVTISEPFSYGTEFILNGTISYGGHATSQWFEVWNENGGQLITEGPVNRSDYSGQINESNDDLIPGETYTMVHKAQNVLGTAVSDTLVFTAPDLTGIEDQLSSKDISLYPNPATDWVILQSPVETTYRILSASGAEVWSGFLAENEVDRITCDNFSKGLYIIDLMDIGVKKKLIIQ
jgi:hypothetical protein